MTQEDARVVPSVVASTLQLNSLPVYVLFDPGATHFFMENKIIRKLRENPYRVEKRVLYKYFFR
jgi:hypothetical protein